MSGLQPGLDSRRVPLLTHLGRFELVRLIAQGGMADVYLARQVGVGQFEHHVAIKVLTPERARDEEARALFLDEARLLAMLHHHNLATVFEVDIEAGMHYMAMEYVHGADLREMLAAAANAKVGIAFDSAISIIAQAAAGLDHAHRRCGADGRPLHLVHRDVSLSNILVGHDGCVKVVDFGIATATISAHVSNPGIVRGKASYMSPEQCLGDPVDLRGDVFALGVVLYELTTGQRCFPGNTDYERMLAVVRGEIVPPSEHVPHFPADLERVIYTALAVEPGNRYASAAALIAALEQVAIAHGWALGTAPILRTMRELFGNVVEPWQVLSDEDSTELDRTEFDDEPVSLVLPRPEPTVVITKPRRIARGTHCETCVAAATDDDQPTRGRRSAPRLWGPPRVAA